MVSCRNTCEYGYKDVHYSGVLNTEELETPQLIGRAMGTQILYAHYRRTFK